MKKARGQNKSKSRSTKNTTKRPTNPNTITRPSGARVKTLSKTRLCGKSKKIFRRVLCKPRSDNSEERQDGKKCSQFLKTKRDHSEEKSTNAKFGRIGITNF